MRTRSIAIAALMSSLLCSCGSSGQPGYQSSQKESPVPAKDPTGTDQGSFHFPIERLDDCRSARSTLIDVREDNEWQAGHAAAAIHISPLDVVR